MLQVTIIVRINKLKIQMCLTSAIKAPICLFINTIIIRKISFKHFNYDNKLFSDKIKPINITYDQIERKQSIIAMKRNRLAGLSNAKSNSRS